MATVIAWGAGHMRDSGINYLMVVHGEQRLKIYEPLPVAANILVDSRVTHVIDKGADKGALLVTEVDIKEKQETPFIEWFRQIVMPYWPLFVFSTLIGIIGSSYCV